MRHVMLDAVKLRLHFFRIGVEGARQRLADSCKFRQHLHALACKRGHSYCVKKLSSQACIWIPRHCHMVHFRKRQSRFLQTIANRGRWKSCRVLHAIESLLFDCRDELPIAHNRSGCVSMVRVNPKNIHFARKLVYRSGPRDRCVTRQYFVGTIRSAQKSPTAATTSSSRPKMFATRTALRQVSNVPSTGAQFLKSWLPIVT